MNIYRCLSPKIYYIIAMERIDERNAHREEFVTNRGRRIIKKFLHQSIEKDTWLTRGTLTDPYLQKDSCVPP